MVKTVRKSSENEYQKKWTRFITFMKDKGVSPDTLNTSHVLEFFMYLFYEADLAPSTVQHFKTALTEPLRALGVEIKIPDFSKLMKAMEIERPRRPSTNPQWSLNTVLRYIDDLQEPLSG